MSRAERMKQERAEQERIRKEFEREKAAAKAKIAREKKREKELAEREHKKNLGMPLVNVRPSQDTIARFVRGNGSGKKRDSGGGTLEEAGTGGGDVEGKETRQKDAADRSNRDRPELDLIPEEDDSELAEILETITNEDTKPPENHPLEQQNPPPHKQPSRRPKSPRRPVGEMKPPPRPYLAKPHSPPPVVQQPPMSTQAILGNLDDFFPSSSQQALELQDESLDDMPDDWLSDIESPAPQQQHQATPPPQRFSTPSGSNELVSLATQRRKRTAAIEEPEDREIAQAHHTGELATCKRPDYSKINTTLPPKRVDSITRPNPSVGEDKENIQTELSGQPCGMSDSQDTEYGGDWMDDLPLDFIV
ncbi:hypothetical protein J3459_008058 [Metarhizium acridum]|nr:hypothetical protein J3459_008058 [Metarhizium acridum]